MPLSFKLISLLFILNSVADANPLAAPDSKVLSEAKVLTLSMINNERGPYQRIRWFCNDGTTLPPKAFACKDHGGGKQYAEYSKQRTRLAELGWHVGTVYTALSWEDLWNENNRHLRLRELPLEHYLLEVDDGWVLRQAQHYRGRVQIEDEEFAGRGLLLKLLNDPAWIDKNFLLVRELIKVVPHSGGEDLTQAIRRAAQNIAEAEPKFEKLRVEVHSNPSSNTADRIRNWTTSNNSKVSNQATNLAQQLDELYGELGRAKRLKNAAAQLAKYNESSALAKLLVSSESETPTQKLLRLANLLEQSRNLITSKLKSNIRLQVLDSYSDIEAEIRLTANQLLTDKLTRKESLQILNALLNASYGAGLLTKNEQNSINMTLASLLQSKQISAEEYYQASRIFNLANNWAIGTVRHTFAEALISYTALNSQSAKYVDDVIRGSVMFPYAETAKRISIDAQKSVGIQHQLFNLPASSILGLNSGFAIGKLRVVTEEELESGASFSRDEIVVLPQTVSELAPVAGVLTYGEGNLLSHVQMLARNFGIPNVALVGAELEQFNMKVGQEVILIVGTDGSIVLQSMSNVGEEQRKLVTSTKNAQQTAQLEVPQPKLSVDVPIEIAKLHKKLSGKVVGPKAANLGELNRLFPGRVAPAIALPFGVYAKHVNSEKINVKTRLQNVYEKFRTNELSEQEFNQQIDAIRNDITGLKLSQELNTILEPMMQSLFGEPGSYGIFIRSDTNVEDLPGFTGAGLSETVANVVGLKTQLETVPRVWSSVLSPRAIAWRSNLLKQPEEVYASVLLMKSVASNKSGVLVTSNLFSNESGITVSTAWGVGGAVNGEAAETVILLDDGAELLVSETKAPYQRSLNAKGGVNWVAAPDGAVLTLKEKQQLRKLHKEVIEKYARVYNSDNQPLPWDIEFGFVNEELTLFQIRPLIERGQVLADKILENMLGKREVVGNPIALTETL